MIAPDTPYAGVVCPVHGAVDLDYGEYDAQMSQPDARWACPKCGRVSGFDDERYEQLMEQLYGPEPEDE